MQKLTISWPASVCLQTVVLMVMVVVRGLSSHLWEAVAVWIHADILELQH